MYKLFRLIMKSYLPTITQIKVQSNYKIIGKIQNYGDV